MYAGKELTTRLGMLYAESRMSVDSFAEAAGVSRSAMQNYLNGDRELKSSTITKICKAFSVSSDWLLGLSGTRSIDTNLQATVKFLGITEKAVNKIIGIDETGDLREALSHLIEQEGFDDFILWYAIFLRMTYRENHTLEDDVDFNFNVEDGTFTLSRSLSREYTIQLVSDRIRRICKDEAIIPVAEYSEKFGWKYPRKEAIEKEIEDQ